MALSQPPSIAAANVIEETLAAPSYADVPPAFYQTGDPPPPPPDDPHFTEWPREDSGADDSNDALPAESPYEPSSRWLVPLVIGGLGFVLMLHVVVAIVLVVGSTN